MGKCISVGWKSNEGAAATLTGVELWTIIKYGQRDNPDGLSRCPFSCERSLCASEN